MLKDDFQQGDKLPDHQWFNAVAKVCNGIITKEERATSEPEGIADKIIGLLADKNVSIDAAQQILLLAACCIEWAKVQPRVLPPSRQDS